MLRRLLPCVIIGATFALALAFAKQAAAVEPSNTTSALSWVRLPLAESCITTSELSARVEKHLGRSVFVSPSVAGVSIEARIEKRATKFHAVVGGTRKSDGTVIGTRELDSNGANDCRSIDDALVLVIALMIDPNALSPAQPPPPPPTPPPTPPEVVHERIIVRDIEHVPAAPLPPAPGWLVEASLGAGASFERAPGVAPAANLGVRFGPSRKLAFEVLFGVMPHAELSLGGRAVEYSIFEGGLAYCPTLTKDRLDFGGCAGLRLGAMRSRGKNFTKPAEVDRGIADIAVGPRAEVRIVGPLLILATANILVPLVRQETTATNALGSTVLIERRRPMGGEIGLALGLRFSP